MMSLHHGWGWQPPQTAFHLHFRYMQSVCSHGYAVHGHKVAAIHSYPHYLAQILGFWVTSGVKMMSLRHGWGWQPPQTASHIHLRHIQTVWTHPYAIHGHMTVASNSNNHFTWVIFWGSWSYVESKWCHYVIVKADSHLNHCFPHPY